MTEGYEKMNRLTLQDEGAEEKGGKASTDGTSKEKEYLDILKLLIVAFYDKQGCWGGIRVFVSFLKAEREHCQ